MKDNLKEIPISESKPKDPMELLLDLACACGNITADVINVSNTGKMHKHAAYDQKKESVIAINPQPPELVLAGVIIPIQLANELRLVAAEIVKARALAGDGTKETH